MHGHHGQRHQQLVLDQGVQVKPSRLRHQQVFLTFIVQCFGGAFVGHEAEQTIHLQRHIPRYPGGAGGAWGTCHAHAGAAGWLAPLPAHHERARCLPVHTQIGVQPCASWAKRS